MDNQIAILSHMKTLKKQNVFRLMCLAILCIITVGCSKISSPDQTEIKNIAYDVVPASGYTVYIKEQGIYRPFLVLTAKYHGNVLLLRQHVMNTYREINDEKTYTSYYANSEIDQYLNDEYLQKLSAGIQQQIVDSKINIVAKESLGINGMKVDTIGRKVFLLAISEVGYGKAIDFIPNEGTPLHYFDLGLKSCGVTTDDGKMASWVLRTPYTTYQMAVCILDGKGEMGIRNAWDKSGVRPAFCVSPDAKISLSKTTVPGKSVYIMDSDS